VPDDAVFGTKPLVAAEQIRQAVAEGVPRAPVVADAAYGNDTKFRQALLEMGLEYVVVYVVGIQPTLSVWPPGKEPLPAKQRKSMGRPPKLRQRAPNHRPVLAKDLAAALAPAHLPPRNGRRSPGAMAQRRSCSPVLRQCVSGRRIGIMNGVNRCRSNGC
jgi:SRSO17 transposase